MLMTISEAFEQMHLSVETDFALLDQITERFRSSNQTFGKFLTPEEVRQDAKTYAQIKSYKDSYAKDNELLEKMEKGEQISLSYEYYYSTEGFIESIKNFFRMLVRKYQEFMTKWFGPQSRAKKNHKAFKEKADNVSKTVTEEVIKTKVESILAKNDDPTTRYLTTNAIYYLLGDDISDLKKTLKDPNQIKKYLDDLVVRLEAMIAQFKRYEDIIKNVAVLIYHCEKYEKADNVNDENIQKSIHVLEVIYNKLYDFVTKTKGVTKMDDKTYRLPELRRNGGYLVTIKERNGYPYFSFSSDREANADVKQKLSEAYNDNSKEIIKDFLMVASKNPKKLEEGIKNINNLVRNFDGFFDIAEDYSDDINKILDNTVKISANNDILKNEDFELPGYHWSEVSGKTKVNFADLYYLIGNTISFMNDSILYQFSDVSSAEDALNSLLDLFALSKQR